MHSNSFARSWLSNPYSHIKHDIDKRYFGSKWLIYDQHLITPYRQVKIPDKIILSKNYLNILKHFITQYSDNIHPISQKLSPWSPYDTTARTTLICYLSFKKNSGSNTFTNQFWIPSKFLEKHIQSPPLIHQHEKAS